MRFLELRGTWLKDFRSYGVFELYFEVIKNSDFCRTLYSLLNSPTPLFPWVPHENMSLHVALRQGLNKVTQQMQSLFPTIAQSTRPQFRKLHVAAAKCPLARCPRVGLRHSYSPRRTIGPRGRPITRRRPKEVGRDCAASAGVRLRAISRCSRRDTILLYNDAVRTKGTKRAAPVRP